MSGIGTKVPVAGAHLQIPSLRELRLAGGRGCCKIKKSSGSNSVVECDLAKVEVAGSNPVSRSRILLPSCSCSAIFSERW